MGGRTLLAIALAAAMAAGCGESLGQQPTDATRGTGGNSAADAGSFLVGTTGPFDTHVLANVGGTAMCVDYADATDAWAASGTVGQLTLDAALSAGSKLMAGAWVGAAQAPQAWTPSWWMARFDFDANGTYTAAGRDGRGAVPPLYYGDTASCPPAPWSLSSLTAGGLAGGITVDFSYDTGCAPPAWDGVLSNVQWDAAGLRMRFSFSRNDGYGPVDFDLRRACPAE